MNIPILNTTAKDDIENLTSEVIDLIGNESVYGLGLRGLYKDEEGKVKLSKSWHSPDGEKEYRLKGTSVTLITGSYNSESFNNLKTEIKEAIKIQVKAKYGNSTYYALVVGDIDNSYSNDIGEAIIKDAKVIAYIIR